MRLYEILLVAIALSNAPVQIDLSSQGGRRSWLTYLKAGEGFFALVSSTPDGEFYVQVLDRTGHVLFEAPRGKGPFEIMMPSVLQIIGDTLIVYESASSKVVTFVKQGDKLLPYREFDLFLFPMLLGVVSNPVWFFSTRRLITTDLSRKHGWVLLQLSEDGETTDSFPFGKFPRIPRRESRSDDRIFAFCGIGDTVWALQNAKPILYRLDIGKREVVYRRDLTEESPAIRKMYRSHLEQAKKLDFRRGAVSFRGIACPKTRPYILVNQGFIYRIAKKDGRVLGVLEFEGEKLRYMTFDVQGDTLWAWWMHPEDPDVQKILGYPLPP